MNKSKRHSFEQLCISKEIGYSCDVTTLFIPSNPNSFDDVVFKLISKIDTSLLLLKTHEEAIESFTVIAIPLSNNELHQEESSKVNKKKVKVKQPSSRNIHLNVVAIQNAWEYLNSEGWHCLQSLALLQPDSIPDNGSRKYSLYQYATCIMDVIRANYMFQKYRESFHHETLETFDEADIEGAKQAVFGLLWKRSPSSLKQGIAHPLVSKIKPAPLEQAIARPVVSKSKPAPAQSATSTLRNVRKTLARKIELEQEAEVEDSVSEEEMEVEEDEEISFKNPKLSLARESLNLQTPEVEVPELPSPPKRQRKSMKVEEPLEDITLGFETSAKVSKPGKKSVGRKSLYSDWPEEERQIILQVFDDLNQDVSEQKRIALTCKYVLLQMGKDLPSKLLYDWVKKKGRVAQRTKPFKVPEGSQQKDVALQFFRELNETNSESARVAFTLKYLDAQFGLAITSKQLFTWLNEKPGKNSGKNR